MLPSTDEPPKEFKKFELPPDEPADEDAGHSNEPDETRAAMVQEPETMAEESEDVNTPEPFRTEREKQLDQQLLFEPVETKEKSEKTPSVRSFLVRKQEIKIIKRIFGGNKSAYHIAIHKLDESRDWRGASKIMESMFIDNGVDPFSKYAVIFTEAVSKRFIKDSRD